MKKAGLWEDHDLAFPSSVGTPKSQRNLNQEFKLAAKGAGLPDHFKLYDLHHTCATLLLSRNVHPKYVQELLGTPPLRRPWTPIPTSCPEWTAG